MNTILKSTPYCDLLAQGTTQEGEDVSAVERIYVKDQKREEIRFAWYKLKDGKPQFQLRPLDLTEEELLLLFKDGLKEGVFSSEFRAKLKEQL
ncbi:hypothetical protein SM124_13205 [Bacillus sp. 31A1R]|uniref:KTSC domain-containing protein n=1 Tax=Robertmurraya mangrovi TaxID=3098077 RepID=A0ABU5J001_9BACI|nr:hypothetical protein [Bacillus sp. 31A1R]MDZ5472690.1 hypothetical protein [Bacillus sp. 31A1R]